MRVAMLGNASNGHTWRWANWAYRQGYEVAIFSDEEPRPDLKNDKIEVIGPRWSLKDQILVFKVKGGPYANNREKWRAYRKVLKEWHPDLLHAHEAVCYGPMLAHFPELPRVLTPWGRDVEKSHEENDDEAGELCRLAMNAADVISTNAPGLEEHWEKLTGVSKSKFYFFSWGVNTDLFNPRPKAELEVLSKDLEITLTNGFYLSPRLSQAYYGMKELLDAWGNLSDSFPALLILRGGVSEEHWNQWKNHPSAGKPGVHLVENYLTSKEMAILYSHAKGVFHLPKTDLLAMSLLECLACGAIPVMADLPCYRSIVEEKPETSRAYGVYLKGRTPEAITEAVKSMESLPEEPRHKVSEKNANYVSHFHNEVICMDEMGRVYELAMDRKINQ